MRLNLAAFSGSPVIKAASVAFAVLASAAHTPVFLLVDAYALRGLGRHGRAYGPVRLWGSAAFIVSSSMNAATSMNNVDRGRWKFVSIASTARKA